MSQPDASSESPLLATMPGSPRLSRLRLGPPYEDIELNYADWGDPESKQVVLCIHGLTRNARDFDTIARALAERGPRVIAVNIVGRGGSSWLADPKQYQIPTYAAHVASFLKSLEVNQIDWIGTSMGGIIGMALAAQETSPIRRLILNDVGPYIAEAALKQIQDYLGLDLVFANLDELEQHLRLIHAGFGNLDDAEWRHLAVHSARETRDGWRLEYDPAIRVPYLDYAASDVDTWGLWDKIRCPTLGLHGEQSTLLSDQTVTEMRQRGPKPPVVSFPDVGHAPALMARDQIATILDWLGLGS